MKLTEFDNDIYLSYSLMLMVLQNTVIIFY